MSGLRVLGLVAAVIAVVLGGLWALNGSEFVGPLVAGLGVALAIVVLQNVRRS